MVAVSFVRMVGLDHAVHAKMWAREPGGERGIVGCVDLLEGSSVGGGPEASFPW